MKKIAIFAAAASLVVTSSVFAKGPSKKEAASAVQAAVKSIESAKKSRGEWRDSYKILGKAKKAYRKGDLANAVKLANKAERQGKIGKAQAIAEKSASIPAYVK